MKGRSQLTGAAGEHYVAYHLSCLGLVAALPRGGAMGVDVLVSDVRGENTLAIQVKTTEWAMRTRGRGNNKIPHELQFSLGSKAAKIDNPNLIFAFVDLKQNGDAQSPDVYLVPADVIFRFCAPWVDNVKWVRLHVPIIEFECYKNKWSIVTDHFDGG